MDGIFKKIKTYLVVTMVAVASGTALQVTSCGGTIDGVTNNLLGTSSSTWDYLDLAFGYDHRGLGDSLGDDLGGLP